MHLLIVVFFFLQGEACWRWISQNNRSGTLWTEDRQGREKNRDNVPEREREGEENKSRERKRSGQGQSRSVYQNVPVKSF